MCSTSTQTPEKTVWGERGHVKQKMHDNRSLQAFPMTFQRDDLLQRCYVALHWQYDWAAKGTTPIMIQLALIMLRLLYNRIRWHSLRLWWAKVIMMWFNRGTKRFFAVTIKFTLRYDKFVHNYKYDTTRDNYATIHSVFDGMRYNSLRLQYDSLPLRLAVTGQWHFGTIHSIYDVIRYDALQSQNGSRHVGYNIM